MLNIFGRESDGSSPMALSFRDVDDKSIWHSSPASFPTKADADRVPASAIELAFILFGHDTAGPVAALTRLPGMSAGRMKSPAHGHDSDSWRIALRGHMTLGPAMMDEGKFSFWPGGRPYGSDDVPWGPEGGWGVVIMGDRRGQTMRTVKKELQPQATTASVKLAAWIGFDMPHDPSAAAGVSTTLPLSSKAGNVDGSFSDTANWKEVGTGARMAIGLFGEHRVGPILLATKLNPQGRLVAERFGTEVVHLVVGGSCRIGERVLETGDLLVLPADADHPVIAAGPKGVSEVIILGDRSKMTATYNADDWVSHVQFTVEELAGKLVLSDARFGRSGGRASDENGLPLEYRCP